ncbi:hypothetical protein Hanom_Chr09g00773591 [Helianthus anomalus]
MSSQRKVFKQKLKGFRYFPGESLEALISRFAELLSERKNAEIVVSTHVSNKKLLDAIKRIPDQANYNWFSNVNQIVLTSNCYGYIIKPDELTSLIKSYDKADTRWLKATHLLRFVHPLLLLHWLLQFARPLLLIHCQIQNQVVVQFFRFMTSLLLLLRYV